MNGLRIIAQQFILMRVLTIMYSLMEEFLTKIGMKYVK